MARLVRIMNLSPICITRARGHQAYQNLRILLADSDVEIDLDGVDMVSASFLDALVSGLVQSATLHKVTFRVSNQTLRDKLARIAATRSLVLLYRSHDEPPHVITPKPYTFSPTSFTITKSSSQDDPYS